VSAAGWGVSARLEVGYKGVLAVGLGEGEGESGEVLVLMLVRECSVAVLELAEDERGVA
jgi:hypothetical protein